MQPDVFILDEPTNHLDIEAIEWLENLLNGKNVTMLLVSHDRYFIDRICNRIVELEPSGLVYKGNYAYYLEKGRADANGSCRTRKGKTTNAKGTGMDATTAASTWNQKQIAN